MDLVYPVRPGDSNEELRYSLRSVAAHLPHGRVWLAGHRPSWVSEQVGHIPVVQGDDKWANSRANRLAACRHPEVSEEFVLFNDDFFAVRPAGEVPVWHRGPVADVIRGQAGRRRGGYLSGARETAAWLRRLGHNEPLSYELHVPMVVTKAGLAETIERAQAAGLRTPHVRTIYGSLQRLGGQRHDDVKVHDLRTVPDDDAVWVSTTDRSFEHGQVGAWIRERLPEPCRYEKDLV